MQQAYIWSEAQLHALLQSPRPQDGAWAVARLVELFPESAAAQTVSLLESGSEAVVLAALHHLGPTPRPECVPILKRLYDSENPDIRTQTLHVCGTWRLEDAIDWVRNRILSTGRFSAEEIAAMIRLLGLITDERAYDLLKGTESAIQEERSWKWSVFYAALLRHAKPDDLATVIAALLNHELPERIRSAALEILLDLVDPTLNPTDVLYGNHPAVREHLLGRLQYLDEVTRDARAPASGTPALHELASVIGGLKTGDDPPFPLKTLESVAAARPLEPDMAAELFSRSLTVLQQSESSSEDVFCLRVLALSALIRSLFDRFLPPPAVDAPWEEQVNYILRHPTHWEPIDPPWQNAIHGPPRDALIEKLIACLQSDSSPWVALHAVEMLGALKAARGASAILGLLRQSARAHIRENALDALKKMGPGILEAVIPLLDSSEPPLRDAALELLAHIPTPQVVDTLSTRIAMLLEQNRAQTLAACETIAAPAFYSLLEQEHRSGEWDIAEVCVHIAHANGIVPASLAAMDRDAREGERYQQARRSPAEMPDALRLELSCNPCGRSYHYLVREIHLHPRGTEPAESDPEYRIPYRQGIVITDEIRCKNCGSPNDFSLTEKTLSQLTSHGIELQARVRLGMETPREDPIRLVSFPGKDGKERSLLEIEQEHLETIERHPGRPESHLAAGKFYEYVKQYAKARQAYLLALDMDSVALEAMAGLARLYHAEGRLQDAFDWIDQCYRHLTKGRIFLAEDAGAFKSTVREKRREYSREAGIRPNEESVEIRFSVETSAFPKNRPCPCGSGRKYKVCCMKHDSR